MHTEYPDYYTRFQCTAGDCRDTCCRSWEVDIDEDTFYYYRVQEGDFGRYLNEHLHEDGEYKYIPMKENGFCPFLTKEGLCDIYCHMGEQAMCQACQEYPRYYMGIGDYEQIDLSLSCMEVGRLLFLHHGPVVYLKAEDEEEPWENISAAGRDRLSGILELRDRLVAMAQSGADRIEVPGEKESIRLLPDASGDAELLQLLEQLEILDDRSGPIFREMAAEYQAISDAEPVFRREYADQLPRLFPRFAVYLIYRYTIDSYYEENLQGEIRFWKRSLRLMLLMSIHYYCREQAFGVGPMINLAHIWSRQIEHSDRNMELLKGL